MLAMCFCSPDRGPPRGSPAEPHRTRAGPEVSPSKPRKCDSGAELPVVLQEVLAAAGVPVEVTAEIRLGHMISDYEALIREHEIDLLVLNRKREDQRAMPGRAYALVVEFQHVPLLLL